MTKCKHCTPPKGLPILPVRYVIAPKAKGDNTLLPQWANSEKTNMVSNELSDQSQLALRTMGKGFLYVLLKMQGVAELCWRVYSIDENGGFWRQRNAEQSGPQSVSESDALTGCEAGEHQSSDVAFITIEQAEKCDIAWFAYSRFKWTEELCQQYADLGSDGESLRNERMEKIEPAKWLKNQTNGEGVTTATDDKIHQVLGYQKTTYENVYRYDNFRYFDTEKLTKLPDSGALSSSDKEQVFLVDMEKFRTRYTCQKWNDEFKKITPETGTISFASVMHASKNKDDVKPMMLSLWDSISIVEDTQLWINQAVGHVQQVELERQREIGLTNLIGFLGNSIKDGAAQQYIKQLDEKFSERLKLLNGETRRKINEEAIPGAQLSGSELAWIEFWERFFYKDEIELLHTIQANVTHALEAELIEEQNLVSIKDAETGKYIEDSRYNRTLETKREESPSNIQYLQLEASYLYQWTMRNVYDGKAFLKPYDKTLFIPIMKLEHSMESDFSQLNKQFDEFKKKAIDQAIEDEGIIAALQVTKQKEEWNKYYQHVSDERIKQFEASYKKYQQNANDYLALLLNDFRVIVDARASKAHPFYHANKEYLTCSNGYFDFIDSILLTLNSEITIIRSAKAEKDNEAKNHAATKQTTSKQDYSPADLTKIANYKNKEPLVYEFISNPPQEPTMDTSNLFWSAILAGKELTKEQQESCLDFVTLIFTNNTNEIDEQYRNKVIENFAEIFNIQLEDFDSAPLDDAEALVQKIINKYEKKINISEQDVKNSTTHAKNTTAEDIADKTREVTEKAVDFYQSTAEYKPSPSPNLNDEALLNLVRAGQDKLSGFFTSIINYLNDKKFTFNSQYGNALFSVVCFGMKVPVNIVKYLAKAFIAISNKLIKAITNSVKLASEMITNAYQKLSTKLQSSYSNGVKLNISRCLLGFQVFSVFRIWQKSTTSEDHKMTESETFAFWSGIMNGVMLLTKSCNFSAFIANTTEKLVVKPFKIEVNKSANIKLYKLSKAGFMRFGHGVGAIGALFGAISTGNEKTYNSMSTAMKMINIVNSIILSIDFICQAFAKKALSTILLNWAARSIVFLVLGRFVAFMLHPLVGLAVFFLTIIVSLVSDNPLQSWFKSNRMGRNYYIVDDQREWGYTLTNYASAYGSYQKELDGLHEILETEEYKAKQQRDKQQLAAQQEFAEQNMQGGT